jgi:hypothetical protein
VRERQRQKPSVGEAAVKPPQGRKGGKLPPNGSTDDPTSPAWSESSQPMGEGQNQKVTGR